MDFNKMSAYLYFMVTNKVETLSFANYGISYVVETGEVMLWNSIDVLVKGSVESEVSLRKFISDVAKEV